MTTPGQRLTEIRTEYNWTREEAADFFGIKYSAYAHYENGTREFTKHALRFANKFKVRVEWLLEGRGTKRIASESDADFVQLMGYVDAGLTTMYVDQSDIHHDPDSLKIAYKDGNRCVALRVRGTSMMPDYKPDSIIIFGEKRPLLELVNQDILAKLTNGAVVLKRLKRGENGSWRLVSTNYEQFEPIENAEIEYARPVEAIILRKM